MDTRDRDEVIRAYRAMAKQLQECAEGMANSLQSVIQEATRSLQSAFAQLPDAQKAIQEALKPIAVRFLEDISAFAEWQKWVDEFPDRTCKELLILGRHGWYFDPEMTDPGLSEVAKAFEAGEIEEANAVLAQHFEERIDEIEESTAKSFPHREKLIRAAFNAHRRGEYELSIPVLFAQADGICKDIANGYLFRRKNKKPEVARRVDQVAPSTLTEAFWSPLTQVLPIYASEQERSDGFDGLNRHMVVHGDSLNYGTKLNGLRAISLISYVAYVLTGEEVVDSQLTDHAPEGLP